MEGRSLILVFLGAICISESYGQIQDVKFYENCDNDAISMTVIGEKCIPPLNISVIPQEDWFCQLPKDPLPCVQGEIVDQISCLTKKEKAFFKSLIAVSEAEINDLCATPSKIEVLGSKGALECYAYIQQQGPGDIQKCIATLPPKEISINKGMVTMLCDILDAYGNDVFKCAKNIVSKECSKNPQVVDVLHELLDIEEGKLTCNSASTARLSIFLLVAVLPALWMFKKFL